MKRFVTSLCLALCAAAMTGPVVSADPVGAPDLISRTVRFGDIDLQTQAGAKVAARRIHIAADYVCGGDQLLWRQASDFQSCRNEAIDRALASLQAPLVSAALGRQAPAGMASR